jgi:hypothetical protein
MVALRPSDIVWESQDLLIGESSTLTCGPLRFQTQSFCSTSRYLSRSRSHFSPLFSFLSCFPHFHRLCDIPELTDPNNSSASNSGVVRIRKMQFRALQIKSQTANAQNLSLTSTPTAVKMSIDILRNKPAIRGV